jgi:general secretion pathway protein L
VTGAEAVLLCLLPEGSEDATCYVARAGEIAWSGRFADLGDQFDAENLPAIPVTIIVPATRSTFRRIEAKGLEPKQELAVAKIAAAEAAIGNVHVAASFDEQGRIAVATVDQAWLQAAIERLIAEGHNVVAAVPVGALFLPPSGEIWRGIVADEPILFGSDFSCLEEPELTNILFNGLEPKAISDEQIEQALVQISHTKKPDFMESLRIRLAAKPLLDGENRKWAKRLAVLAVGLLVAAVLVHWARVEWATSRENDRALAAAQQIDPAISDIETAETAVEAALARKGIERGQPSMLIAIVWQAVRTNENVALTSISLQNGGLLNATLAAPDSASANAALIAIQRAGYKITAKPRSDQSGTTLVDLTVRAP